YSKSSNGREKTKRSWLMRSKSKGALFCIPCLLFSNALCKKEGFNPVTGKWRKLYEKLPEHEKSNQHQHCYWQWRNRQQPLQGKGIDSQIQKQIQSKAEKQRALLERLLDAALFLASRNMAFRGSSSKIGNAHSDNFLSVLELISHYNPLLHDHLAKVKESQEKGEKMQAHYLSWKSQNEFIELCGQHVLNTILTERNETIYFSIICDATPDISHTEQNVLIVRYMHKDKDTGDWKIYERFIEFFDLAKKHGQEITEILLQRLQKHIHENPPLATYSPCACHSLNLVGVHAAQSCPEIATFFGRVNRLYVFFSGSPERWAILKEKTGCSLHSMSETRWTIHPVAKHLPNIIAALESIIKSNKLSNEALSEAKGLKSYFKFFTAIVLATFCFKERNLLLQSAGISLDTEVANIADLQEEMQVFMNEWNAIISEARIVANSMEVVPEFKSKINWQRKCKQFHDESPDKATSESAEAIFWNTVFYVAMDNIISKLNHRFQSIRDICNDFAPVLKFKNMNADEIITSCKKLANKYSPDLTSGLASEVQHLKKIYSATFPSNLRLLDLLNAIYKMKLETIFGEICIAIRIFCTLPLTVAEGERAFSKLSIIKNYLRSTMSQNRLSSLAILSMSMNLLKIDFRDIIRDFVNKKAQRCVLLTA
uniref:HAT C-terminal dimerisation domain-containing protein n=1 Tax=Latimeria chalumnae TaxID=7897 RepID=H3A3S2_LATCH